MCSVNVTLEPSNTSNNQNIISKRTKYLFIFFRTDEIIEIRDIIKIISQDKPDHIIPI